MQAALGLAQLERARGLPRARRRNFDRLRRRAVARSRTGSCCRAALPGADPSWFGYPFTLREGGPTERRELQRFLQERRIDSRLLLGGNLTRQPGFRASSTEWPGRSAAPTG